VKERKASAANSGSVNSNPVQSGTTIDSAAEARRRFPERYDRFGVEWQHRFFGEADCVKSEDEASAQSRPKHAPEKFVDFDLHGSDAPPATEEPPAASAPPQDQQLTWLTAGLYLDDKTGQPLDGVKMPTEPAHLAAIDRMGTELRWANRPTGSLAAAELKPGTRWIPSAITPSVLRRTGEIAIYLGVFAVFLLAAVHH
jgi:hypothetical protein